MKRIAFLSLTVWMIVSCCGHSFSTTGRRVEALEDSCWSESVWISAQNAEVVSHVLTRQDERSADGASWFVSTIRNEKRVVRARWMTTGLGVYSLFINGDIVGNEFLKPGFTHYAETKYSFTYDITDALTVGEGKENTFSAQVTPGWWADKIISPTGSQGMTGRKCAFRCVIELLFEDGSRQLYGTNLKDWKSGIAGPVRHASIYDGEEYDAGILPGHDTEQLLQTPEENKEFRGEIFPSEGAEVYLRHDLTLKPVDAYVYRNVAGASDGEYGKVVVDRRYGDGKNIVLCPGETLVVDFGQNAAAVPCFEFAAAGGTRITCLPAEILNDGNGAESRGMDGPEGSVHRRSLRIAETGIRLDYTFSDKKGYVRYHPQCTFFGYRYISVTGTGKVKIRRVESIPVTSITKTMETGHLETGNEMVNKLISNTTWGMRSNYLSVPTDCPQRDERLAWTADTQVFARTATFFADVKDFLRKWMRDMRDSQSSTGGFPGVAPAGQYGKPTMRVGWADAGVIVPWTLWKQYADTSVIDENWDSMAAFMAHVNQTRYDHDRLRSENQGIQWADWLSYEPLESNSWLLAVQGGTADPHPSPEMVEYWNYLGACYWASDAAMMKDMALATGRDGSVYQDMADTAKEYIRKRFLNGSTFRVDILNTMQTPALFALKLELVEGEDKEALKKRLRDNFAHHGNRLQTGFLGTSILMQTLTENGMSDIAYELLFQRKNPSWLYSIDNGATTIWERWNSYTVEHGMGHKGMNSFNHYAYGCVCEWLWETVAGISSDTSAPGFSHVVMKPVPDRRLGYVNAEYKSSSGVIKSSWRYEGDLWIWEFAIPQGVTASVTLPGEPVAEFYSSGSYIVRRRL